MIVYINSKNEIKDVDTTTDATLTPIEMPEDNPFANWSVAKICCHKLSLNEDGSYKGYTPYVDTRIIEKLETESRLTSLEETVDVLVLESLGL